MDLFRKCMEPVEKCLRDAKMDKAAVRSCSPMLLSPHQPSIGSCMPASEHMSLSTCAAPSLAYTPKDDAT